MRSRACFSDLATPGKSDVVVGSIVYDGGATQGNDEGRGKPERLGWVLYGSFEFTFDDYLAWSQLQVVTL